MNKYLKSKTLWVKRLEYEIKTITLLITIYGLKMNIIKTEA